MLDSGANRIPIDGGESQLEVASRAVRPQETGPPGFDHHPVVQLGGRMHDGGVVNHDRGDDVGGTLHLSTILAVISASATNFPSTLPFPLILHALRRMLTTSISKKIWSPGVTGRLHFTLFSDMK